jgi:hypothetical protein
LAAQICPGWQLWLPQTAGKGGYPHAANIANDISQVIIPIMLVLLYLQRHLHMLPPECESNARPFVEHAIITNWADPRMQPAHAAAVTHMCRSSRTIDSGF